LLGEVLDFWDRMAALSRAQLERRIGGILARSAPISGDELGRWGVGHAPR
jgi:hypothetical protein